MFVFGSSDVQISVRVCLAVWDPNNIIFKPV